MIRQNVWFNDGIFKMPKMFALFACAMLVSFAARAADDDMSLIDLFGKRFPCPTNPNAGLSRKTKRKRKK